MPTGVLADDDGGGRQGQASIHQLYWNILPTRMPFELMTPHATFQRVLNLLRSKYTWKSGLVYLDDISIFSKIIDQLKDIESILATL